MDYLICSYLLLLLIVTKFYGILANNEEEIKEFCQLENFRASCPLHHVIVMTYGRYGRMRLRRCLKREYGHLGCSADVLPQLDRRCSGRQECSFKVSDLHGSQPCPDDLTPYLEASYNCISVYYPDQSVPCELQRPVEVTSPSGSIGRITTQELEYGSDRCPWLLKANPGQRINITVMNFFRVPLDTVGDDDDLMMESLPPRPTLRPRVCYQLASIEERVTKSRYITECEGGSRENHVTLSKTEMVKITVQSIVPADLYFILHFEHVGCANPVLPAGAHMRRVGDNVEIKCNFTDQSWKILCDDNQWHGPVGNCTKLSDEPTEVMFGEGGDFPFGILLVVSIGVALGVFFGGILLTIASIYMKKRRLRRSRPPGELSAIRNGEGERIYNFTPDGQNSKNFLLSQTVPFSSTPTHREGQTDLHTHTHHTHGQPQCLTLTRASPNDPRFKDLTLIEPTYHHYPGSLPEGQTALTFAPRLGGHIYESPQFEQKPS